MYYLQDVLHPKDALNQRYPRKRAIYLAGLAQHLAASPAIGAMRYSCLHGNRLRPILLLSPPGTEHLSQKGGTATVLLHCLLFGVLAGFLYSTL